MGDDELFNYDEEYGVIPEVDIAGLFIRDYILVNGPSSAWRIYRAWKKFRIDIGKRFPSYQSFWRNYIWPLKKLGLLIDTETVSAEYDNTIKPKLLAIYGDIEHPAWWNPRGYLYGEVINVKAPKSIGVGRPSRVIEEFREAIRRSRVAKAKKGRKKHR